MGNFAYCYVTSLSVGRVVRMTGLGLLAALWLDRLLAFPEA